MPTISEKSTDLVAHGARVALSIMRPTALSAPADNRKCHDEIDVLALIDTGADYCALRESLADELCLQKIDEKEFGTSAGPQVLPIYLIDLVFPQDKQRRTYEAAGCTLAESIEFLLGRDFLRCARLNYEGIEDRFELEFT